jgi:hypothetical protein
MGRDRDECMSVPLRLPELMLGSKPSFLIC